MGCGTSSQPSISSPQYSIQQATTHHFPTNTSDSHPTSNTSVSQLTSNVQVNETKTEKTSHIIEESSSTSLPRGVKLEVGFGNTNSLADPPERISKLKQESKSALTGQMLVEKQELAELRYQKQLELKANPSNANYSHKGKLRKEIMAAKDFEKAHKQSVEIEKGLDTAESKRTKLMDEKVAKIRLREQHAKQVRERAKRSDLLDDLSFDSCEEPVRIEQDRSYNTDTTVGDWDEMNDSSFLQPDPLHSDDPGSVITM